MRGPLLVLVLLLCVGCADSIDEKRLITVVETHEAPLTKESEQRLPDPFQVIFANHRVFVDGLDNGKDCFSQTKDYQIDITVNAIGFWVITDADGESKTFGSSPQEYFLGQEHAKITLKGDGNKIHLHIINKDGSLIDHVLKRDHTGTVRFQIIWGKVGIDHEVPIVKFVGIDQAGEYCVEFLEFDNSVEPYGDESLGA